MNRFAMRLFSLLAATAAVASLTGCENPVVVTGVDISHNYSPLELSRYGSGGNELRVAVTGDPFGDGGDNTAFSVVDAMQGNTIGTLVTFAIKPIREAQPPSRVVLYLNPRPLVGAETLCAPRSPVTTARSRDGKVKVSGAWCQSNFTITRADARIDSADGLASEEFRALIGQLTIALFPPKNPHDKTDLRPCPPFCR